ncbi:methyl-accepting chemotaxis sensory transducer [Aminomonas paucivorans DSM 12260]|uniref:Methyl-accepting chemotaxis sensory transducer n=1 Tax=Aminomonas paucivorans DSM 12260 TaxID=584708 RepID=E3CZB5_9BACT|nr:phosphate/phosphite/phosphonate ABC transporter substrate-binding protein [Aminomonas paucivorans]EFQ24612.1 methyl-accepting chemotaxis sensory transducer [Aminomonas paucivorans DSM 12260]
MEAKDAAGLSGVFLDAAERLGMKLQQTLWVGKEQARAAEALRGKVLEVRERLSSQVPRIGGVARGVAGLAEESVALGERARSLAEEEERARGEIRGAQEEIRALERTLGELERAAASNEALTQGLLEAAETVSGLLAQIGKVTRQTQMLALNAAIEAARAGDAGRGFSVVAREVGNLAVSTQDIAVRIDHAMGDLRGRLGGMVEGLSQAQEGLRRGAGAVQDTARTVDRAGGLALRMGEGLQEVSRRVVAQAEAAQSLAGEARNLGEEAKAASSEVGELDGALAREAESAGILNVSLGDMGGEVFSLQTRVGRCRPPEEFWVGFTPFAAPEHIRKTYGVAAEALARRLGRKVRVFVSSDYHALGDWVREGVLDLAWFSPLAYVVAAERVPMQVLAIPRVKGHPSYRGLLLARKDRGIRNLGDLKGKVFAFVDPTSGSGYLYPRVLLQQRGFDPETFFGEVRFLGSHDRVIRAVLAGEVDGGASYTDAWDGAAKVLDLSPLQILAQTEEIPKDALAVRRETPPEAAELLRQALLDLTPTDPSAGGALRELGIDGFVPGEDRLYDVLRAAREAEKRMRKKG